MSTATRVDIHPDVSMNHHSSMQQPTLHHASTSGLTLIGNAYVDAPSTLHATHTPPTTTTTTTTTTPLTQPSTTSQRQPPPLEVFAIPYYHDTLLFYPLQHAPPASRTERWRSALGQRFHHWGDDAPTQHHKKDKKLRKKNKKQSRNRHGDRVSVSDDRDGWVEEEEENGNGIVDTTARQRRTTVVEEAVVLDGHTQDMNGPTRIRRWTHVSVAPSQASTVGREVDTDTEAERHLTEVESVPNHGRSWRFFKKKKAKKTDPASRNGSTKTKKKKRRGFKQWMHWCGELYFDRYEVPGDKFLKRVPKGCKNLIVYHPASISKEQVAAQLDRTLWSTVKRSRRDAILFAIGLPICIAIDVFTVGFVMSLVAFMGLVLKGAEWKEGRRLSNVIKHHRPGMLPTSSPVDPSDTMATSSSLESQMNVESSSRKRRAKKEKKPKKKMSGHVEYVVSPALTRYFDQIHRYGHALHPPVQDGNPILSGTTSVSQPPILTHTIQDAEINPIGHPGVSTPPTDPRVTLTPVADMNKSLPRHRRFANWFRGSKKSTPPPTLPPNTTPTTNMVSSSTSFSDLTSDQSTLHNLLTRNNHPTGHETGLPTDTEINALCTSPPLQAPNRQNHQTST